MSTGGRPSGYALDETFISTIPLTISSAAGGAGEGFIAVNGGELSRYISRL